MTAPPGEAKFIGSPIDYLVFRNMSKGDDSEDSTINVLLDVRTGKSTLSGVHKKIEAAAAAKRVSFDVLRIGEQVPSESCPKEAESRPANEAHE